MLTLGVARVSGKRYAGPQRMPRQIVDDFVNDVPFVVKTRVFLVADGYRPLSVSDVSHQIAIVVGVNVPSSVQQQLRERKEIGGWRVKVSFGKQPDRRRNR